MAPPAPAAFSLDALRHDLGRFGFILRGGLRPGADDLAPEGIGTLLLVGNAGPALFRAFAAERPSGPNPLDRWTAAKLAPIAAHFGARALFPFDGPPHWPFQRWAQRAEPVRPSPLGILIHPRYGLWHAYRAAFGFESGDLPLPQPEDADDLCAACPDQPCLSTCPVGAFTGAGYDVPACVGHLRTPAGEACLSGGCLARRACPIGRDYAYDDAQANLHMTAFERA